MSKVLWLSDGGCSTGFGRVTHSIGERLVRDHGHEVHVLAVNYRGDAYPGLLDPTKPTPLHLYMPTQIDPKDLYGMTRIVEMLDAVKPDVVVSVNDPQTLLMMLFANRMDPERFLLSHKPIISYTPCDGLNLPDAWQLLGKATNMVTMADWGSTQYPDAKLRVYHGVDSDQFWPVSAKRPIRIQLGDVDVTLQSKSDCKKALNLPVNAFIVGRVDSNSERKDYAATWKALVPFMRRHPDVMAHFHCAQRPTGSSFGVDMNNLLGRDEGVPPTRFSFPEAHSTYVGWAQPMMNALYNAFDVFISTSHGEGFGLTLAEAAAAGVPIIAQNVSAIPEVVGPGGILLEPERLTTVPSGEDQWLPNIAAFTDALERVYKSRGLRRDLGAQGHQHVVDSFSWDEAATSFSELIAACAAPPPKETGVRPDAQLTAGLRR